MRLSGDFWADVLAVSAMAAVLIGGYIIIKLLRKLVDWMYDDKKDKGQE